RRLVILFVIGLLALLFIAPVLILMSYAVLGLVLLVFRNQQPRSLLVITVIFLLVPFAYQAVDVAVAATDLGNARSETRSTLEQALQRDEIIRVRSEGTYFD
ncbi:MAG: hypothetical protein GTO41_00480, partial [Burkholderiales bacterium]|nr:hypothetical protein [Burkholderiales bacterium]